MAGVAVGLSCSVVNQSRDSILRAANRGDEPALAAIDALVNPSPWTASQFASACAAAGLERALVAEHGEHIAGFVVYSCVLDEACIHNVAVHPADQRRGLGRGLLRAALEAARDRGARRCCLEVRVSNRAARGLYRALGFREDGLRKNYYSGADQSGADQSGADQSGADQSGADQSGAGLSSREDAVLLSIQL